MGPSLVSNSAFSGLDIFGKPSTFTSTAPKRFTAPTQPTSLQNGLDATREAPIIPLPPLPTTRTNSIIPEEQAFDMSPIVSRPIPARGSSLESTPDIDRLLENHFSLNSPEMPSSLSRSSSMACHSTSPKVLSGGWEMPKRGTVHLDQDKMINWARPLRVEADHEAHLFGHSTQRNCRLNKRPSMVLALSHELFPTTSPSSSSDDEALPVTPGSPFMFIAPPIKEQGLKGLGMDGIMYDERDSPTEEPATEVDLSHVRPHVAQQIHALPNGAPATLAELRQLRSAASMLENQVRKRSIVSAASPVLSDAPLERPVQSEVKDEKSQKSSKRIRRKAVPTLDLSGPASASGSSSPGSSDGSLSGSGVGRSYRLSVAAPLIDSPRSGTSHASSNSVSSGPFDLSSGTSSGSGSDAESSPPMTPPHSITSFPRPSVDVLRPSASDHASLRRSAGIRSDLATSTSMPLYVRSVHGEVDGWWSSSDDQNGEDDSDDDDDDVEDDGDELDGFEMITPSTASRAPRDVTTPTPMATRRTFKSHFRSASDDTGVSKKTDLAGKQNSFYGNKTAFMSTFFGRPMPSPQKISSPSPIVPLTSTSESRAPSSWRMAAATPSSPTPLPRKRASMQVLFPSSTSSSLSSSTSEQSCARPAVTIKSTVEQGEKEKKSFYSNSKAFRSVMDLGSMRRTTKGMEGSGGDEEKKGHRKGLSRFFKKLAV